MRRIALAVALAGTPGLACILDGDPTVDLDLTTSCSEVSIETLVSNLLPEVTVHAALADGEGKSGWAITEELVDGVPLYRLVRFPDTSTQVVLSGVNDAADLMLLAAPVPGHAWVLETRMDGGHLWHADAQANPPLVASNANLSVFPGSGGDEVWTRRLVFLGGDPYLVAIPDHSDDHVTSLWVARLTGTLGTTPSWKLEFQEPCMLPDPADQESCEADKADIIIPELQWLAGPSDPRAPAATLLLKRRRARQPSVPGDLPPPEPELEEPDLLVLSLSREPSGQVTPVLRTFPLWDGMDPFSLAVDDLAIYVSYLSSWGTTLLRFDEADSSWDSLDVGIPQGATARMLQLDGDIASAWTEDGDWHVIKVFAPAPPFSRETLRVDGGYTHHTGAGPGHALLHRATAAPDLVRLRCVE